jgi:hypothetical protein
LKQLICDLDDLACDLDEQKQLEAIFSKVLENEKKIEYLIEAWCIDSPTKIKEIIDFTLSIDIEFPPVLIEQLKLMYKQSLWLIEVNKAAENPYKLTLEKIQFFIDKAIEDRLLLASSSPNSESLNGIQKTFIELQDLLSIAQTWNDKAKNQLESRNNTKLAELEKTLMEAKCIPARMENVDKLERIVKEANDWLSSIDNYLGDKKYPFISDLVKLLNKANSLPVKFNSTSLLELRINVCNEWTNKLCRSFLKSDHTSQTSGNNSKKLIESSSIQLLELLTPRLDLLKIIKKIETNSNQLDELPVDPANNNNKLRKNRSLNRSSTSLNNTTTDCSVEETINVDSVQELYSNNTELLKLQELIKLFELKELNSIKQIRQINNDKLDNFLSQLNLEMSKLNAIQSENSVEGVDTSNAEKMNPNLNNKVRTLFNSSNIKCCSCFKSILTSIVSNNSYQCKLCLGIFHSKCCKVLKFNSIRFINIKILKKVPARITIQ